AGGVRSGHRGALEIGVVAVRHGGEDAAVLGRRLGRLVPAVAAGRRDVDLSEAVVGVVRLEVVLGAGGGDRGGAVQLGRHVDTVRRLDGAFDRFAVVGAGVVGDLLGRQVMA